MIHVRGKESWSSEKFHLALIIFEQSEGVSMSDESQQKAMIAVSSQGENWGTITLQFYPDVAPNHVNNFCQLAKDKFYDGCTFHRVIP